MASLDLEIAHITSCSIAVDDINLTLRGGLVQTIAGHTGGSVVHKPGDQITHLYKLVPDIAADGAPVFGNDGHTLALKIEAKVLISHQCCPNLAIEWRTNVDFTIEQNPSLIKATHRLNNSAAQHSQKTADPDSLPSHDDLSQQADTAEPKVINVTLTISSPSRVHVGDTFHWDVFIVNRSEKTRKLAVLIIPKRKRDLERHKSHPSTSSVGGQRSDKKDLLASAVLDENIIYAKQKNARIEPAELLCLTTDVRTGHLAPGACYTADLKFLALSTGVLDVDALRVVDLATQEVADVRDLPSIVAVE